MTKLLAAMTARPDPARSRGAWNEGMKVRVNVNDQATVRLAAKGRHIWHESWARHECSLDHYVMPDGTLRAQLWRIMQIFGPHMGISFDLVFETEIEISIPEPTLTSGLRR